MWRGIIEEFRHFLPVSKNTPVITLGEGGTPLLRARNIERELGFNGEIWLKCEGANPTGSFKDRGMAVAVSKAMENGYTTALCASTGNTASSAAAYCALVGMKCFVLMPEGGVSAGKLVQTDRYGTTTIQIKGNFDEALEITKLISQRHKFALLNSLNPDRLEGQKTAAFEIVLALERMPNYHFIPVGNAGNITAYWMGYQESDLLSPFGTLPYLPKMMGYQAAGAAPIVRGRPVKNPKTIASAIKIGNPASWQGALDARDESGGVIDSVTDKQILAAYDMIPRLEGVFCEPASAASVAGLIKALKKGQVTDGSIIVCTLTGNGLKDTATAQERMGRPIITEANPESILKLINP